MHARSVQHVRRRVAVQRGVDHAAAARPADPRLRVQQAGRLLDRDLGDQVDDVHPEAVDAPVEPPPHHRVDGTADLRVLPVEVGLAGGEQVQVVLAAGLVPGPGGAGEHRAPVGGLGARLATGVAGPWRPPPVPVALGVLAARARLGEPGVRAAGVVDHEVHHQPHAARVHLGDELVEVLERAEHRVDVVVVADVVAVVVHRRAVDRAQPHHVDAEALEVVEPAQDAAQVTDAVAVRVGEAPGIDLVDDGGLPPVGGRGRSRRGRGHRRHLGVVTAMPSTLDRALTPPSGPRRPGCAARSCCPATPAGRTCGPPRAPSSG